MHKSIGVRRPASCFTSRHRGVAVLDNSPGFSSNLGSETTAQALVALRGEEGDLTHSVNIGGYELPI